MPANQKYSSRVHTKRQLGRAVEHIQAAALVLFEVGERYQEAAPTISTACKCLSDMVSMAENMLEEIRSIV